MEVPTRLENILDLIFINNIDLVENIEVIENVKVTDHKLVIANLSSEAVNLKVEVRTNFCSSSIPKYNLNKANPDQWKNAREDLKNTVLDTEASPTTMINDLVKALETIVTNCFTKPSPPSRIGSTTKSLIPKNARTLMRRKLNLSRSISKEKDTDKIIKIKLKIEAIEEDLRKSVHKMRAKKELLARANLTKDPNLLHELVKKLSKKSSRIGPLKNKDTTEKITDAEILSRQYSKVFTTPDRANVFDSPEDFFDTGHNPEDNNKLKEFTVSIDLIKEAIDSLPPKAAPGPDGVPNILLKQLKHEISPILQVIFSKSLDKCDVPESFRIAFIKPVKKPLKPRSDPSSYRPLSLTSNLAKILEKVVKKQLQKVYGRYEHPQRFPAWFSIRKVLSLPTAISLQ